MKAVTLETVYDIISITLYKKCFNELEPELTFIVVMHVIEALHILAVKQGKGKEIADFNKTVYEDIERSDMSDRAKDLVASLMDKVRDDVRDVK